MILPKSFYLQPTLKIAQDLLGCFLVRKFSDNQIEKFMIVETEAYDGLNDKASHASRGLTPRNQPMFEMGGITYIYFTYGMHHMLNIVTGKEDYPAAVLIRAVEPVNLPLNKGKSPQGEGAKKVKSTTNGPAKLTKSLKIDKALNSLPVYNKKHGLWIEGRARNFILKPKDIIARPRIGIDYAEEYKDKPWRFYIKDNNFISKK